MKRLLILTLACVALAGNAEPKKPEKPDPNQRSKTETRLTVAAFARCVVSRRANLASKMVMAMEDNRGIMRRYSVLIDGGCLEKSTKVDGPMLTMPGSNFGYAIAEALVRLEMPAYAGNLHDAPNLSREPIDAADYLPKPGKKYRREQLEEMQRGYENSRTDRFADDFGECVVRVNTAGSHHLLMTEPAGPEERAAFVMLKPSLGRCLAAGQQFKADMSLIRGAVALNYYRLAKAGRPSAVAPVQSLDSN